MNIRYKSPEIQKFYSQHRTSWKEFYPSEQFVFERVVAAAGKIGTMLDVGGAAGGLGRAMAERFGLGRYTCVDINSQVIMVAKEQQASFPVPAEFICDDVVSQSTAFKGRMFDVVSCLGCADWNLQPAQTIGACWDHVAPGGQLIISLRLTNGSTVNDITRSYQFIHFGSEPLTGNEERANYVVLNVREALALLYHLESRPSHLLAYGYWGKPSAMARTPHDRIVFTVFALTKGRGEESTMAEVLVPLDLLAQP